MSIATAPTAHLDRIAALLDRLDPTPDEPCLVPGCTHRRGDEGRHAPGVIA